MEKQKVKFVDFTKEYHQYKTKLDEAFLDVMERGDLILRQDVEEFEEKLAEFVGTEYAIGVNSGTDALLLSLKALGVGPGDEVITVGHTFHATVEVIHNLGATPVLINVGEDGMMNVKEVEPAITEKTAAIIPVHLMGDMVDMDYLLHIANYHQIPVVEDACQALGSERDGWRAGAGGHTGCFSFYPAKILGAAGDAGAIVTDDPVLAEELKNMRQHYKYNPGKWGFNSRLDNIQAALLNVKIDNLPAILKARASTALYYDQHITNPLIKKPTKRKGRVYQDYIIRTEDRDGLADFLAENGIETMKNDYHFPDDCPKPQHTIELESQTLRIPCNETLTVDEMVYVVNKINEWKND